MKSYGHNCHNCHNLGLINHFCPLNYGHDFEVVYRDFVPINGIISWGIPKMYLCNSENFHGHLSSS